MNHTDVTRELPEGEPEYRRARNCHDNVSPALAHIVNAWDELPPHVKEAIVTLVDAAMLKHSGGSDAG